MALYVAQSYSAVKNACKEVTPLKRTVIDPKKVAIIPVAVLLANNVRSHNVQVTDELGYKHIMAQYTVFEKENGVNIYANFPGVRRVDYNDGMYNYRDYPEVYTSEYQVTLGLWEKDGQYFGQIIDLFRSEQYPDGNWDEILDENNVVNYAAVLVQYWNKFIVPAEKAGLVLDCEDPQDCSGLFVIRKRMENIRKSVTEVPAKRIVAPMSRKPVFGFGKTSAAKPVTAAKSPAPAAKPQRKKFGEDLGNQDLPF